MGTFDSVYLNKIRQLEEENQQLRNIIDEAFAGISRRTLPKDLPTPIDGRGAFGGRGIGPEAQREWLRSLDPRKIDKIDLSKILSKLEKPNFIMNNPPEPAPIDGRDVYRRANAGMGDDSYMPSPSKRGGFVPSPNKPILDQKPKPGDAGPQLTPEGKQRLTDTMKRFIDRQPKPGDAGPMPRPQGRSEPAPYASDDMESRRAEEAERVRGERLRNELRGGGPQYRPAPPKSDLSFW